MSGLSDYSRWHPTRLRPTITRRVTEPAFWAIQAAVLLISFTHLALEAGWILPLGPSGSLPAAHHIPVILYLIPVAYAGLVYGWEGGVLTGVWAGILASVNVVLFSLQDYEWVLEIVFVVLVIGMGIVMALPVERERTQRRRAEAAVRRLEALNDLAHVAVPARTPGQAVTTVLSLLVDLLSLDDAGFILWRRDEPEPVVYVTHQVRSDLPPLDEYKAITRNGPHPIDGDGYALRDTTVAAGQLAGLLVVKSDRYQLDDPEFGSFLSAVGNQLAVRVENALLLEQEQAMWSTYVKLVTKAQEEERRRLARDLHDGPAQRLAILVRSLEDSRNHGTMLDETLRDSASEILGEVRRVARDQRPTLLDDLGIVPALEWLVADTDTSSLGTIALNVEGETSRLAPETEVVLYRIAQEGIRNAQRHAKASRVIVTIRYEQDDISLSIADDGTGFDVPASAGGYLGVGRLGLMGMHERAQLIGGSLDIRSTPESGTVVTARAPRTQPTSE